MKWLDCQLCMGLALVLVSVLATGSPTHAQVGGAGPTGVGAIPGSAYGGATDPSMVQVTDGFKIIPAVIIAGRFDSNVFFAPKSPGLDRSDYVTTVAPQIRALYAGSLMRLNVTGGALGEYYVKNQGLSYVGVNAGVALDVSPMLDRLWKESRLTVTDTYSFTPQPPAFLTGNLDGEGENPYTRGYQVGRVNVRSNVVSVNLTAPVNQTLSVIGNYNEGFMKYGSSEVAQIGSLLSTTFRSYGGGLSAKVSPQDTLSLNQTNSEFSYGSSGGGSFSARGGTIGWIHAFTPNSRMDATGGVQALTGSVQSGAISTVLAPSASVRLSWKDRETVLMTSYSIVTQPTFQFESQALLVHTGTISVTQITPIPQLLAVASVSAGVGRQLGSSSASSVSYSTYGGTGGVVYKFSPSTFMSLNYSYSNYESAFGVESFNFDRHVVQFNLTQAFY